MLTFIPKTAYTKLTKGFHTGKYRASAENPCSSGCLAAIAWSPLKSSSTALLNSKGLQTWADTRGVAQS